MNIRDLPPVLESVVGKEKIDFSVHSTRNKPPGHSIGIIIFGVIWLALTGIFVAILFVPILKGEEVQYYVNNEQVTASLDNLEPLHFPAALIGFFVLVGIIMLLAGFISYFKPGGHYVGTASRLLRYHKGKLNAYDWKEFTGNIEMNVRKGALKLQLRSGFHRKSGAFVHDVVYIAGAPDVLEIEKICRQRMKEV